MRFDGGRHALGSQVSSDVFNEVVALYEPTSPASPASPSGGLEARVRQRCRAG